MSLQCLMSKRILHNHCASNEHVYHIARLLYDILDDRLSYDYESNITCNNNAQTVYYSECVCGDVVVSVMDC